MSLKHQEKEERLLWWYFDGDAVKEFAIYAAGMFLSLGTMSVNHQLTVI